MTSSRDTDLGWLAGLDNFPLRTGQCRSLPVKKSSALPSAIMFACVILDI